MKDRFKIIRDSGHGRSEYKSGRWLDEGQGHIYSSLKTALTSYQRIVEQYPAYKQIVDIHRV